MFIERMQRGLAVCATGALLAVALPSPTWAAGRFTNHLDASMINEIVLHDGLLYMATFGGILIYDPVTGEFEQYGNDDGLTSNAILCLAIEADGDIYAGSADIGVAKVRIANGRLSLMRSLSQQIDGLASNRVNSISVWGSDIVYGATPGAGVIRNDFASAPIFQRDGLPGPDVFDVMPFGDEAWMATVGGVATLNSVGIVQTVAGSPAQAMVIGSDGTNIYVGTNTGVRRFDGTTWTDIGPAAERIRSLFWDGSSMWAGAARNFMRYTGTGTTWVVTNANFVQGLYAFSSSTTNLETKGLAVLPGGDVYVGSGHPDDLRGANLMRLSAGVLTNITPNAPGANFIRRMDTDIDGSLWASFNGFYVGKLMPNGNWLNYNSAVPGIELPTNPSTNIAFLCDSGGHKWFSSLSNTGGPYRPLDELDDQLDANYANDVWVRHAEGSGGGDGYGTLRPQRAAEDPRGNRWFLSDDLGASLGWEGINILSQDKTEWFQMNPGKEPRMIDNNVIDVAFGSFETYVAFLNSNGVYRWRHFGYDWPTLTNYASDSWSVFLPVGGEDGLPSASVISRVQLRSDGLLWVATDAGLFYTFGGTLGSIPVYVGISPGIIPSKVQDILLDHDENLWVATELGLNRIARDDNNDIQTFLTLASYALLSDLRYSLDVISPLAHADCRSLALHPTEDVLYIGTFGGISIYDFSAPAATATDLSKVYVYPNPVYTSKGHVALKIANLTGPVSIEIYNLEGELVDSRTVSSDGEVAWDLTTRDGFNAGSGKYIVRIVGESGSVQRPFALIR